MVVPFWWSRESPPTVYTINENALAGTGQSPCSRRLRSYLPRDLYRWWLPRTGAKAEGLREASPSANTDASPCRSDHTERAASSTSCRLTEGPSGCTRKPELALRLEGLSAT